MNFRIADTFIESLAKLTGEEQKAAKTTAFDLQLNPATPGMSFHKLDKARDKHFASLRVSSDLRIIVHKTADSLLLCYVDHHDAAYNWAARRKLATHPTTGAAQLVEIRETVQEITIPKYVDTQQATPMQPPQTTNHKSLITPMQLPLFAHISETTLLGYGVPEEWLADVQLANEDSLLTLADHLPAEAAEALLTLATGGTPTIPLPLAVDANPFDHPDAQRRFRVIDNVAELTRALEYPWDKWTIFLHPAQRQLVERNYNGPARVSGSAGTGKTIVALHRAAYLARSHADARVLLTTFSDTLANALRSKLHRLLTSEPRLADQIEVQALDAVARHLYQYNLGDIEIASSEQIRQLLNDIAASVEGHKFSQHFLCSEWLQVVDAWQIKSWEAYRDVARLGRKTRLPETQRAILWEIFSQLISRLAAANLLTEAELYARLTHHYSANHQSPFEFCVVDEAQDISIAQLRFLAAIAADNPNSLFFAGDLGQQIFQLPFSWKSLGVDIRGRSRTLQINYRTSHQIRMRADLLLGPELSDVDGNIEDRRGTVSVFNGPTPAIESYDSEEEEIGAVGCWLTARSAAGVAPHEIGVFVRSEAEIARACQAVAAAGLSCRVLDDNVGTSSGQVSICTMHLAKGLEFRAVAVMACDDEVIPLQSRLETAADSSDLEDVYNTERHLLYVACTRARDFLIVTSVDPASEFLEDFRLPAVQRVDRTCDPTC